MYHSHYIFGGILESYCFYGGDFVFQLLILSLNMSENIAYIQKNKKWHIESDECDELTPIVDAM